MTTTERRAIRGTILAGALALVLGAAAYQDLERAGRPTYVPTPAAKAAPATCSELEELFGLGLAAGWPADRLAEVDSRMLAAGCQ